MKIARAVQLLHDALKSNDATSALSVLAEMKSAMSDDDVMSVLRQEVGGVGTCLHTAVKHQHLDVVRALLSTGADVNSSTVEGTNICRITPLHISCAAGNDVITHCLLEAGANVNAKEGDGLRPLHCACQGRSEEVVRCLLDAGAEVNVADGRGESPLQTSILRAPTDVSMLLVARGADVHVKDHDDQTPLHYASEWGNAGLVASLLDHGADPNARDATGRTPMHVADNESILEQLRSRGGDVSLRDNKARRPLAEHIDVHKHEYSEINAALGRHLDRMADERVEADEEKVCEVQTRFNQLAVASGGDEGLKAVKGNVMAELLGRRRPDVGGGNEGITGGDMKVAVMKELLNKTQNSSIN